MFIMLLVFDILIPTAFGQRTSKDWLKQLESTDTRERVEAVRGLSIPIIRRAVNEEQRATNLAALQSLVNDKDPVVRLTVNLELLKIAASEGNSELAKLAMKAAEDENINVRRGMMKFFRTFYSGRYEFGKEHEETLFRKLDEEDLEIRFHAAATLHSWKISNRKIVEIMLDSLDLNNYRSSTIHSIVQLKKDWPAVIDMLMERLAKSEHNAGVYINLVAMLTPESNPRLIQLLPFYKTENVAARAAVIGAIGRMNVEKEASLETLADAIDDDSDVVRGILLKSMVKLQPEPQLFKETMLRLLRDDSEQVSLAAADAFSFFEGRFDQILPEIEDNLESDNKQLVISTLNGCTTAGPMAAAAAPAIIKLLRHENPQIQTQACWALYEVATEREAAISALNELLASEIHPSVLAMAMDTLSQFKPTDEVSRKLFLKQLDNTNPHVRFICCEGLKNYPSPDLIEKLINLEPENVVRPSFRPTNLDAAIVQFLKATGEPGARKLVQYLGSAEPFVRIRAIRGLSNSSVVDGDIKTEILRAIDAEDTAVRLAAVEAASHFDGLSAETLERMFDVTSSSDRRQTVEILGLFSRMGAAASPISPKIASLMNGAYRNRFSHDAKKTLVAMGEHAAPAVPVLLDGELSISKIDCLAAIGAPAREAESALRAKVSEMTERIQTTNSIRDETMSRRVRIAAAIALWRVSGNPAPASLIVREELPKGSRQLALVAAEQLGSADHELVDLIIEMLPDKAAINSLGNMGELATPAVAKLEAIAAGEDHDAAYLAVKALWQIKDDPKLAVEMARKIIESNRFEPVEIRLKDRQRFWETLRYLASTDDPEARQLLDEVERGRFPNLRNFVRQLPRS